MAGSDQTEKWGSNSWTWLESRGFGIVFFVVKEDGSEGSVVCELMSECLHHVTNLRASDQRRQVHRPIFGICLA